MPEKSSDIQGIGLRPVFLILAAQTGITALAALVLAATLGGQAAWSALVGGGISLAATAYFAVRVFAGDRSDLKRVVRAFYVGEAHKIVLTAVLIVVAIKWLNVAFMPMFGTYMATLLVFWFALLPVIDTADGRKTKKTG